MPVVTSDGATLRAFAEAVMRAAEHNVEEVVPVVLAVVGGILSEADPGSVALRDGDDAGDAPVVWAAFAGRRTAFRFNPMIAMIELRADTLDGHPLRLFGRRSLHSDIVNFFGTGRSARLAREGPPED
ncbi:hypothetical protein Q8W71_20660 [Methylobacterium sp. NEAU 140]|uniref:hypothetical protein n=1 Tax=Methylobacterium sp. NEAU 140 TaxID=3064945 RepID=UPI002734D852|nr:hypothetical protein [Methylobacterium sp. NEAU 140]MDP4025044.1 hypothetical protein [Methylobacterium sp. NEAU 140]